MPGQHCAADAASAGSRRESGEEFLIPNEDLTTQQVANWSYSSDQVRIRVPVGVSCDTDIPRAVALCREAAEETARVLLEPKPSGLLKGFGDSSVDLELRFWIRDPPKRHLQCQERGAAADLEQVPLKPPAEIRVVMDNAKG